MTQQDLKQIENLLVEASGRIISALLIAKGTPLEHELASYRDALYALETRMSRGDT